MLLLILTEVLLLLLLLQWMMWHIAANVLLAGSVDGEIYMWKIPDGDCKVLQGYGCRAETGAIFPDGIHFFIFLIL